MPKFSPKRRSRKEELRTRNAEEINSVRLVKVFIFVALAVIVVVGPFFRGLYFPRELLPVHLTCFALFTLWWGVKLYQNDGTFIKTPLDYCILGLVILYMASIIVAVNKREAIGEFLKMTNYFVIYLLVAHLCAQNQLFKFKPLSGNMDNNDKKLVPSGLTIFLHVLMLSGFAVALGGLGAAGGVVQLPGAYVDGRIFSPLQYPNTAAVYFIAALILVFGLMLACNNIYLKLLYLPPAVALFIAIILTYSRAAWLLLPPLFLIYFFITATGNRLRLFLYFASVAVAGTVFIFKIDYAFRVNSPGLAFTYILLSLVMAVILIVLAEQYFLTLNVRLQAILVASSLALFLVVALGGLVRQAWSPLNLKRGLHEPYGERYIEQVIDNPKQNTSTSLSLEVKAVHEEYLSETPEAEFVWRLTVSSYHTDPLSTDFEKILLVDHREGITNGWENRTFPLLIPDHTQRLEVRLYHYHPGTAVTIRNPALEEGDRLKTLTFLWHRVLPSSIYERLFSFRNRIAAEQRWVHLLDGMKIVRDYPIMGAGGGAWNALYLGYINKQYFTAEPHSHFIKVWIEAGLFAFLAFLGVWVFFCKSALHRQLDPQVSVERKQAWTMIFIAATALGLHALIDFSLSLGAVSVFLFALLGAARSLDIEPASVSRRADLKGARPLISPRTSCSVALLTCLFFFSYTFFLWSGYQAAATAAMKIEDKEYMEAEAYLLKAIKLDPVRADSYAMLANIYSFWAGQESDENTAFQLRKEALNLFRKAQEREPYHDSYNRQLGMLLLNFGYIDEGIAYIKRTIEVNPYNQHHFSQAAVAYLAVADYYRQLEKYDQARAWWQEVLLLEDIIKRYHHSSRYLAFYLGKAGFLLEDYTQAASYFLKVEPGEANYEQAMHYLNIIALQEVNGSPKENN